MEDLAIFGRLIAFIAFPIGLLFLLFNPLIGLLIIIASIAVWNICGHCLKKEGTLETQNIKASKIDSHSKQLNENLKEAPQKTQFEITSSKLSNTIENTIHNKPQLIWMVTCMILMLLFAGSLSEKVSKEDYESLQNDYDTLQEEYDSLQAKYDESVSDFKSMQTKLNDTLSAYEEYQERMQPFDSLTDDELNTVASKITQTPEEKHAEETIKAQAQAVQQPVQENMVWIPRSGSKYHSNSSCSNMKSPSQVNVSQAQASGYEPCKKCY